MKDEREIQNVCREKLAYVDFDSDIYKLLDTFLECDLLQMKNPIGWLWLTFYLSPKNPLRGLFNHV